MSINIVATEHVETRSELYVLSELHILLLLVYRGKGGTLQICHFH